MHKKKNVSKIIISMALALLLVFGILASPLLGTSKTYAAATTRQASTWAELRDAISDSANGDVIEITQDIMASKAKDKNGNDFTTIDISGAKTVTIKAKDGENVTIYRKKGESDFPMFKTSNEKAGIILGEGLTLTGQQVEGDCSPGSGFTVTFSNGGDPEKTETKTFNADEEVYKNPPSADWNPGNGYQFVGWTFKTSADGASQSTKGTQYPAYTGFTVPEGKKGEMTVVAEYERTNFVVTWSNGVSGDGAKTEVWDLYGVDGAIKKSVGETLSKTPGDDWKPGADYVFKGWKYILSEGGSAVTSTDGNVVDGSSNPVKMGNTATNMTIVAQWEKPAASSEYHLKEKVGNKKLVYDTGGRVLLRDISGEDPNYKYVRVVSINSDGVIAVNVTGLTGEQYVICQMRAVQLTNNKTHQYFLKAHSDTGGDSGTPATTSSDPIYLYSAWPKGYISGYSDADGWEVGSAMEFTLTPVDGGSGGGGSATPYTSQVNPVYDDHDPEVYSTTVQPTYSAQDVSQGCDGPCTSYTENDFASGESGAPRGFFVQVEAGTVSLEGATLENFNTSTTASNTPKFVAPVAVIGENSTFDVKSGNIRNNIVGYIAKDENSNWNANAIKKYVKGGAPNAKRTNAPDRRWTAADLDVTGTAGAIIYANGADGTISGGNIGYNRGDTGGVMVTDSGSFVTINGSADINHNIGVQFGGGTTVENGGSIYMDGGKINNNIAWFGGGAVFATENGIDWLIGSQTKAQRQGGNFTLNNGELAYNSAFTRGGAILVDSNGVALLGGSIHDNTSRMLGGAAYVMGDHPDYSYTLYIEKGEITNNEAIPATWAEPTVTDTPMSKKIVAAPSNCGTLTDLFGEDAKPTSGSTDDTVDPYVNGQAFNDSTGGGVWVCAYGSTVLDLDTNKVWIHGNKAYGSTGDPSLINRADKKEANTKNKDPESEEGSSGGKDFHSDNGGDGTLLMMNAENSNWYDENTKNQYDPGEVDGEIRNLTFTGGEPEAHEGGVQIYNNASRRGGGLAADGTFVFGKKQDVARVSASLSIEKVWEDGIEKKPVIIEVSAETADGKSALVQTVELDGQSNYSEIESEQEGEAEGNKWTGGFTLPASLTADDGTLISVFKLVSPDGKTTYDPQNSESMAKLAEALEGSDGSGYTLSSDVKLVFNELVRQEDGTYAKSDEFKFKPGEVEVEDLELTVRKVTRVNAQGETEHVLSVSFTTVTLKAPVRNEVPKPEKPELEKYVNKDVTWDFTNFDQVFTYDVMAYVTNDADTLTVTDTINSMLEFVGENGSLKIADLGTTNNHKTTVKNKGKDITAQAKTVTASGSDVKVVIEDLEAKGLRGHWIKVTFDARIKDTVYETVAQLIKDRTAEEIKDTDSAAATSNKAWVEITDNGSVKIDTDHDGIPNRAHYELKVGDSGKHELDSNTVTVEPKTTTVWAKKTWQDEKGNIATWPKEVTEVTVNVYGADKETPVCTITLKDGNAVESEVLPCLEGVEYTVDEVTVPGYTEVGEVQGTGTEDDPYVFTNKKNAGPEIEKYVNKKDATPEQRDGTVHTDLSAFDEVYTYDIQAYITKDAKYVEVIDQLVDVLEFTERADESFKVVVKDGDGEDGITAPALSKEPLSMEVRWSADFGTGKAGQLVVMLGSDDKDAPVLPYAGKWIQITFDAKIKDEYKTVEALKAKGINVWTTIKENDPVEDADTTIEFSGATAGSHEGIINESSYYINKIAGADIGNEWQYSDRSNVVTVQPPTPVKEFPVYFSKNELGGSEIEGAHIVVNDEKGKLVEEWDSTTESHKLDLKPGKYTMEETVAPEGFQKVTTVIEFEVDKDGKVTLITTEVNGGGKISVTDINHVILEDAPEKEFPVYFSKNELGGSEIEGAHIVVNDEKGKLVEEWDSTTESHKLDLKPGKYTMEETVAPEGFQKVTTVIEFEVDKDGKVTLITTEVNGGGRISVTDINHVILEDAPKPTESSDKEKQAPDNDSGNDKTDKTNNDDVSRIDDKTKAKSGNASGRKSSANTGDENNASLWFLLIIAAAVALPFAIKKVRQK